MDGFIHLGIGVVTRSRYVGAYDLVEHSFKLLTYGSTVGRIHVAFVLTGPWEGCLSFYGPCSALPFARAYAEAGLNRGHNSLSSNFIRSWPRRRILLHKPLPLVRSSVLSKRPRDGCIVHF